MKVIDQSKKLRVDITQEISSHLQFSKFFHKVLSLIRVVKYIFEMVNQVIIIDQKE